MHSECGPTDRVKTDRSTYDRRPYPVVYIIHAVTYVYMQLQEQRMDDKVPNCPE